MKMGNNKCPVCEMMVGDDVSTEHEGKTYYFMNPTHKEMFLKDPSRFLNR